MSLLLMLLDGRLDVLSSGLRVDDTSFGSLVVQGGSMDLHLVEVIWGAGAIEPLKPLSIQGRWPQVAQSQ